MREPLPNRMFLLPLAASGHSAFQALLLSFSAAYLASSTGLKDSVLSIQHRSRALRLLQSRLSNPSPERTSDKTITAILAMASKEVSSTSSCFPNRQTVLTRFPEPFRLPRNLPLPHARRNGTIPPTRRAPRIKQQLEASSLSQLGRLHNARTSPLR